MSVIPVLKFRLGIYTAAFLVDQLQMINQQPLLCFDAAAHNNLVALAIFQPITCSQGKIRGIQFSYGIFARQGIFCGILLHPQAFFQKNLLPQDMVFCLNRPLLKRDSAQTYADVLAFGVSKNIASRTLRQTIQEFPIRLFFLIYQTGNMAKVFSSLMMYS